MSSIIQVNAQVSSAELLDSLEQLDGEEFEQLVARILAMQANRRVSNLPQEESELLQKINLGIPARTWQRYHQLQEKRSNENLTTREQQEIIAISDDIEQANVERLKALIQLAKLRQTDLETLMNRLGISPTYMND